MIHTTIYNDNDDDDVMTELTECELHTITEIQYQLQGIVHEIRQKSRGGFWSQDYINEKCDTIKQLAKDITN